MATFEQIAKANAQIKLTDIGKGKLYPEVNQRIKAFRMVYPDGYILTDLKSNENGVCIFTAAVGFYGEDGDMHTIGTGTAYEKENSTFINKTSYIENCETSAVGRALAMAGFGIDTSVASLEEVQNAIANQTETAPAMITEEQTAKIKELISDIPGMLKYYKINNISELTAAQAAQIIYRKEKQNG